MATKEELEVGTKVLMKLDDGGRFTAEVQEIEEHGHWLILRPMRDPVRDVFPNGYKLGAAHWAACLEVLDR